jgi:glycogen debranching enzyme
MGERGQEDCSEPEAVAHPPAAGPPDAWASGLDREWLVTDGRGGYASGTVTGPNTRRYHGLLVAPLAPAFGRTVLLARLEESLTVGGVAYPLSTNEFQDGTVHPQGFHQLQDFALDGGVPTWRFAAGGARLERRVWMTPGRSASHIRYRLSGEHPARLALLPLCTYRDFHQETVGSEDWRFGVERQPEGLTVLAFAGATPFHLLVTPPAGREWTFDASGGQAGWWWRFLHREERERGLDAVEDLYGLGTLACDLLPGESLLLTVTLDPGAARAAPVPEAPPAPDAGESRFRDGMRRAARQFLVAHPLPDQTAAEPDAGMVIAGYHWLGDWSRDTMVALPGLVDATGEVEAAGAILRAFARYVDKGMLPNRLPVPSAPLSEADYSTADATLWFFRAVAAIDARLGGELVDSLLPVLSEILDWHIWGTRHGIRVDPHDGLLRAENGQLTWMDTRVGDWLVTPRAGKPVEVAALWHHALGLMAGWCERSGRAPQAAYYGEMRRRAAAGFAARFWFDGGGYLFDAVDGPGGNDGSLRPNQIIAAALPDCPLTAAQRRAVVDVVERRLWTPRGLRTLDRDDPRYRGRYGGDAASRDGAYHQGTVWPWLLGPLVDARLLVDGDRTTARRLVAPLRDHFFAEAAWGSVSEVFDGDPPHAPGGCIARAWSVAEVYRAWRRTAAGGAADGALPGETPSEPGPEG